MLVLKFSVPLPVRAGDSMPRRSTSTLWPLALIVIVLSPFSVHATGAPIARTVSVLPVISVRKNGRPCDRQSRQCRGFGYRHHLAQRLSGQCQGSDGTTYRQDSLGNVRGSNATSGERVTWREDTLVSCVHLMAPSVEQRAGTTQMPWREHTAGLAGRQMMAFAANDLPIRH